VKDSKFQNVVEESIPQIEWAQKVNLLAMMIVILIPAQDKISV
jgi:hypothetical protein